MDNTFRANIIDSLCCCKDLLCFAKDVTDSLPAFGKSDDEEEDGARRKSKSADVSNDGTDIHANEAFQSDSAPPDDTNIYQDVNEVTK